MLNRRPHSGPPLGPSTYTRGPNCTLIGCPPIFSTWLANNPRGTVHCFAFQLYVDSVWKVRPNPVLLV